MSGFTSTYGSPPAFPRDYSASGGTTVTVSTLTIPGLSHSFTAPTGATYIVVVTADVLINTAGTTNIVEAVFDGGALTPGINTSGPAGMRVTGAQTYFIINPSAAAHTITVQSRNAAGGSATVNQTHTRLAVWRLT